jgi:hypothetical protein
MKLNVNKLKFSGKRIFKNNEDKIVIIVKNLIAG